MAGITEITTGAPYYSSVRPNSMAPVAMTLKLNGYATAQFGKNHEVPVWETSPVGPFDAWPTGGGGFEYFYGFLGGEANQWYPTLYEGTTPVENKKTPEQGYHLVTDMTDKTIKWISQQKVLSPDKPLYANKGKLKYCYNWGGFKNFMVEATDPLTAGERQVRMEFAYDGGGLGKGGMATLYTDGVKVAEGRIDATLATIFSADDGTDVGEDSGAAISPDYGPVGNHFNGEIKGVQLSIADDPNNHIVNPEDAIRAALGRQ
jgi:arylsulfatase A-like enzyme